MKKTIYLSVLAGFLVALGACDTSEYDLENQIPERFHKIMYLQTYGKHELTLYETGDNNVFNYTVIKGGSDPSLAASTDIKVLSQEELDEQYSDIEGVNYKLLAENSYTIEGSHLDFTADNRSKQFSISIDPEIVKQNMENEPDAVWVLPLYLTSENDSINADKNSVFLQIADVVKPTVGFTNVTPALITKQYGLVETITQEVPFRLLGVENTSWDIACEFTVDEEYVDTYNTEHGTVYQLLENTVFDRQMALEKGVTEKNLTVTIEGSNLQPGDYMLPIRISNPSLFTIEEANSIYPLILRIQGEQLDRTEWTAEGSSAATNEGTNGPVEKAIDGDVASYWHTPWSASDNPPSSLPHWMVIDTKKMQTFTQVAIQHRAGSHYAQDGNVYVSETGADGSWVKAGTFKMEGVGLAQMFAITPTDGRYLKLEFTSSSKNESAFWCIAIAEVYAYGMTK